MPTFPQIKIFTDGVVDDSVYVTLTDQLFQVAQLLKAACDEADTRISGIVPGEANTGLSLGTGNAIFAGKVGVQLQFKSLIAGTNIGLVPTGNDITVNATAPIKSYAFISLSADQTSNLAVNNHVEFNTILNSVGGITISSGAGQANGLITLDAGKTYKITARIRGGFSNAAGWATFQIRNNTAGALIGRNGITADMGANTNAVQNDVMAIITTSAPTVIEVREISLQNNYLNAISYLYSSILIEEM